MTGHPTSSDAVPAQAAGSDFPFYADRPATISVAGWLLVMAGVAAAFGALVVPMPIEETAVSGWLRVIAFVALPLIALAIAAKSGWTRIFGRVGWREVKLMVVFALLNIAISMAIGALIQRYGVTSGNAAIADATGLAGPALLNFFAKVGVQLLGEELITILPFLAILTLCTRALGLRRRGAVIVAWLVSAAAFGLVHLPTYQWNVVQCLVVIGSARLVLTAAYMWSKNLWVSTGAHVLNDWALIAFTVFVTPLAPAPV